MPADGALLGQGVEQERGPNGGAERLEVAVTVHKRFAREQRDSEDECAQAGDGGYRSEVDTAREVSHERVQEEEAERNEQDDDGRDEERRCLHH